MKILKKGRQQRGYSSQYICTGGGDCGGGCGAFLLVEAGDFHETDSRRTKEGTLINVAFQCPACGVRTYVYANSKERELARKNGPFK